MDFEFDTLPDSADDNVVVEAQFTDPVKAVEYFDDAWYIKATRRARRMDLIGDYAGSELFVIDGDSLLQEVLQDSLLALGRDSENSFQILHAYHSLEKLLDEYLRREAVFELVFFDDGKHSTVQTGSDDFVFTSLCLARSLLIEHVKALDIPVFVFRDALDDKWIRHIATKKPMFIMLGDAGVLSDPGRAELVLVQRTRFFLFMAQGLSCTLLPGTTFRDSKISTFVFEQRFDSSPKQLLGVSFSKYVLQVKGQLDTRYEDSWNRLLPVSSPPTICDHKGLADFLRLMTAVLPTGDNTMHFLLYAFAAHLVALGHLSVYERGQLLTPIHPDLNNMVHAVFLPKAFLALASSLSSTFDCDLDGRVFTDLVSFILGNPALDMKTVLGEHIWTRLDELWKSQQLSIIDVAVVARTYPSPTPIIPADGPTPAPDQLRLRRFSNAIFDSALADSGVELGDDDADGDGDGDDAQMDFNTVFQDQHHWHNSRRAILPKHLGGEDKLAPLTDWQKKRQLRSEQRFTAKLQWQAESLTGAFGKALQKITILSSGGKASSVDSSGPTRRSEAKITKAKPERPGKKGQKPHISKAEQIRMENAAKKASSKDESNEGWWREQLQALSNLSTVQRIVYVDRLLENGSRGEAGWLAVEIRLYRLHLEFTSWIEHPDSTSDDEAAQAAIRDKFSVSTMRMIKELCERGRLFPAARKHLSSALQALGFEEYMPSLVDVSPLPSDDDRKLAFSFVKLVRSKTKASVHKFMSITEDPIVWQLRLFGEFMDRSMDSQEDRRVSFKPDAWQRQVLDCLDEVDQHNNMNHSVLVVAPTSAGKTFISYYAMEQVLRRSDDEVLVYVAPTKALVSQIAAEVYARFNKSYKAVGKSCWAIHTRDYRVHNPQNCQILVTVPEMLAIMLLSPPLARVWTPRIKRIILDEIHSIGQQEGGAVWEQIILLAPCPIVGLSATVGHPEKFNEWLASVQRAHGFRHSFIHHPHRYSHLRKFHYMLQVKPGRSFTSVDSYESTERMRFLHPVSLLSADSRSLPPDFSLEAADCLTLYEALSKVGSHDDALLQKLDPTSFFSAGLFLKQKDILRYEGSLKDQLSTIVDSSDAQGKNTMLDKVVSQLQDPKLAGVPPNQQNAAASIEVMFGNLIYLACDLRASGDLPALFFQFDRSACEFAVQNLLIKLEAAEEKWRATSPEWALKIRQWEAWKAQAPLRAKQAERLKKQRKDEGGDPAPTGDSSWESSFDPDEPSPQFSFLSRKCSMATINEAIEDLRWTKTPSWALEALRRGVGVHHSGMNKHYRTAVESLYRMGYVQIVAATGTLALGINAPTRTSVFCGDSPFLTALQYRQCAGRAGRRGYDLLGKVVFYGLPMDRVQRLVLSKLPSVGGNFPLTSTMVLRLFNLLQGSGYAEVAVKAIRGLLQLPQVSFVSDTGKQELVHHIRFSIEYLRRAGLLDADGNPINLFGLAAHLYYTEPSNFALVTLMRNGIIHNVCNQTSAEKAKRDFLTLICHLFGRRLLPSVYATDRNIMNIHRKSASRVILPPLPEDARQILKAHDADIIRIFSGYAVAYAQHAQELGADTKLPLSKHDYTGTDTPSAFREHLRKSSVKVTARSPFVATSGHTDHFTSVSELSRTCRSGIHLNEHGVPSMQEFTSVGEKEGMLPLNAYLLDFYTHGQADPLVVSNGIRRGDLWYLLDDFVLTLKTIRATVERLLLQTSASEDDELAIEAGDPAEVDMDDRGGEGGGALRRPPGVSERDWKVFEVVDTVLREFDEKFKAMWA